MSVSTSLRAEYQGASLLGKARIERRLWDALPKEQKKGRTKGELAQEWFGADPIAVTKRSNLLKKGVTDPLVWAQLDDGPSEGTTKAPFPTSRARKTTRKLSPQALAERMEAQAADLSRLAAMARELSQKDESPISLADLLPGRAENLKTDVLYNILRDAIYDWLSGHSWLSADHLQLYALVRRVMAEFYETLEYLTRSLQRLEGTRVCFGTPVVFDLRPHFEILGLPVEDVRSSNFDLAKVRRQYRKYASKFHPDHNGGQNQYVSDYVAVNEAMKVIEQAYEAAKETP